MNYTIENLGGSIRITDIRQDATSPIVDVELKDGLRLEKFGPDVRLTTLLGKRYEASYDESEVIGFSSTDLPVDGDDYYDLVWAVLADYGTGGTSIPFTSSEIVTYDLGDPDIALTDQSNNHGTLLEMGFWDGASPFTIGYEVKPDPEDGAIIELQLGNTFSSGAGGPGTVNIEMKYLGSTFYGPTSLAANTSIRFRYELATDEWYRIIEPIVSGPTGPAGGDLSGTYPNPTIRNTYPGQASIVTVGTIATGVWQGTPVAEQYGGTNQTTYAPGDMLYASAADTLAKRAIGPEGYTLQSNLGFPMWLPAPSGELVYSNIAASNIITANGVETAFAVPSYTIPANSLVAGTIVRIKLFGIYSNAGVSPTINIRIKIGGTTYLASGVITTVTGMTDAGWWAEGVFTIYSVGATGTVDAQGFIQYSTAATTGLAVNMINASTQTLNTTINQAITVTAEWGQSGCSIQIRSCAIYTENLATSQRGRVLIQTYTAVGAAGQIILLPGGYSSYDVEFINHFPTTLGTATLIRAGYGAGPTIDSGATKYWYIRSAIQSSGADANQLSAGGSSIVLGTLDATANMSFNGVFKIRNPTQGTFNRFFGLNFDYTFGASLVNTHGSGVWLDTQPLTAIQISGAASNITGIYKLWGNL